MKNIGYDALLIVLLAVIGVLVWVMWHEFSLIGQMVFR